MVKKIICGIIFLQNIIYGSSIELDFAQFDNYKRTSDMIYDQVKNDSRSFSYNRIADLSKLPEYYLQQMSQPALESLEMQRKILKHLLENHIEEISENENLKFEFIHRAADWEKNNDVWNKFKTGKIN